MLRDARGRKVFATKLAQVYPNRLCKAVAGSVFAVVKGNLPRLLESFQLQDPDAVRKRPVGYVRPWQVQQLAWPQQQATSSK